MFYNYKQESLFDSTEHTQKTGGEAPEFKNSNQRISSNFGIKNKISQEITESKNFFKKFITGLVIIFALFSFTSFWKQEDVLVSNAEIATIKTENGREVTPQVIAELKAESVKNMTPEQKKEALKILIHEADENTLLEILK